MSVPSEGSGQPGHQADLSLRWAHSHSVSFVMLQLISENQSLSSHLSSFNWFYTTYINTNDDFKVVLLLRFILFINVTNFIGGGL